MKAICNTSPIIGLTIIGHLDLLWELFDIYVPQEVYNEVVNVASDQAIGKHELRNAVAKGFIKVHEVKDQDFVEKSYGRLHKGELEVILGAKEIGASIEEKNYCKLVHFIYKYSSTSSQHRFFVKSPKLIIRCRLCHPPPN